MEGVSRRLLAACGKTCRCVADVDSGRRMGEMEDQICEVLLQNAGREDDADA